MKNKELKILLSAPRGFCAGVERAIEKHEKMREIAITSRCQPLRKPGNVESDQIISEHNCENIQLL